MPSNNPCRRRRTNRRIDLVIIGKIISVETHEPSPLAAPNIEFEVTFSTSAPRYRRLVGANSRPPQRPKPHPPHGRGSNDRSRYREQNIDRAVILVLNPQR